MGQRELFTGKLGRYTGRGDSDPIQNAILGEHAPQNSPFHFFPLLPHLALQPGLGQFDGWDFRSMGYQSNLFTVTTTGTGAAVGPAAGGLVLTTGNATGNNTTLQFLRTWTPADGKLMSMFFRVQASEASALGIYLGAWATDADPSSTEPTDFAFFRKLAAATVLLGRTNDAGGTPSNTANINASFAAATNYDLGLVLLATGTTTGTMLFYYKLASASTWDAPIVKTSDFPDAAVRFGMSAIAGQNVSDTVTLAQAAFWML